MNPQVENKSDFGLAKISYTLSSGVCCEYVGGDGGLGIGAGVTGSTLLQNMH